MTKFVSILISALMLVPATAATTDIFIQHDKQMDAMRRAGEAVVISEDIPAIPETAAAVTLCEGVSRVPKYNATADELEQLVILCYLEAGGEPDATVRYVAEVVFNRLASGIWGNSLTDVIYAPWEFEPACNIAGFDTHGNKIIEERMDEIRDIVYDIYYNGCELPGRIMFFRTDYYHTFDGAVDEFAVGNVYFSSSMWCEV